MNYEDVIACLFEARSSNKGKGGFEAVKALSKALGSPEKSFASVHIAGTNGKGSVSTKMAKVLELSGYKVGLYTSPHLYSYRERIRINGELISEEDVVSTAQEIFQKMAGFDYCFNFFEMTTLLAFCAFAKKGIDIAIVETGMGGGWDPTNIVEPILSVITSIGKDHMPVLGETLEVIASQKAGIIKPGVPVVLGPHAQYKSIRDQAEEFSSPCFVAKETAGFYDNENSEIAQSALSLLKTQYCFSDEALEMGLQVRPPCRFEEVKGAILDVAHNEDGFKRLLEALECKYPHKPFRMLIGMSQDKDVEKCLKLASQQAKHLYLVQAQSERAASTKELKEHLVKLGYLSFSQEKRIAEGVQKALRDCAEHDELLVIAGSFYIMKEAKEALGQQVASDLSYI